MRISAAALGRIKTFKSNIKAVCCGTQVNCLQLRVGSCFPSEQLMTRISSRGFCSPSGSARDRAAVR